MPNKAGNLYGLTTLCPLLNSSVHNDTFSPVIRLRELLEQYNIVADSSPMRLVPNTYLARFFILDDVIFQSFPYQEEHLKSKYLVFTVNFHGELEQYLEGMYNAIPTDIASIWRDAVGFNVKDAQSFTTYIKKCQVETTFLFNGSTDMSLADQLKSLYIKQEFSDFVFKNQGVEPSVLLQEFKKFIQMTNPTESFPTWKAGVSDLNDIIQYK